MCGIKSKRGWLFLVGLLLLSQACYSADVQRGGKLYQITESELTELEQILTQQAQTIVELSTTLDRQAQTITNLENTLTQQQQTIETLSTSFDEYESAVQSQRITRAARNVGLGLTMGIIIGIITSSFGG